MITFYECLQEYRRRPDAIIFTKKAIKRLSNGCKVFYDRNAKNPPISYIQSFEDGQTFTVRNYPYSFKRTIVGLINMVHDIELEKIKTNESKLWQEPVIVKKTRKRIILKKPAFSVKLKK